MFAGDTNECQIPFLDCRGVYDLTSQIIGLLLAVITLYASLVNFRQLRQEKNDVDDSQNEHNLHRKIIVNLLNIIYLLTLITTIVFSMVLFQEIADQSIQEIIHNQLEKWYKISEIMLVQILNVLLLTVGLLYWQGLYFFFKVQQVPPPLFFRKVTKLFIYLCGLYCIATLAVSVVVVLQNDDGDIQVANTLVVVSCAVSITLFLFFRISYYKNIFRSIRLGRRVVNRQRVYNTLIVISSLTRITLCIIQTNGGTFDSLRTYNNECYDVLPYHAILLLVITIAVDLLPSFLFSKIFTTLNRQRRLHRADIDETLFSAQPSEFISGSTHL